MVITVARVAAAGAVGYWIYMAGQDLRQVRDAARQVERERGCRPPEDDYYEQVHEMIQDEKGRMGKCPMTLYSELGTRCFVVVEDRLSPTDPDQVQRTFQALLGLRIFKSWNVFATRMFYFAKPDYRDDTHDGEYRLTIECPWRIEMHHRILVGSEDYRLRAIGNEDPNWDGLNMQEGHLQDQILTDIFGGTDHGAIVNRTSHFVVEGVDVDCFGGFRMLLSGEYCLSVFPASAGEMEWLLSSNGSVRVSLRNGRLFGRVPEAG